MSLMKFYMTPGSCSTGIHILLEELGLVFEAHIVNLPAGEQYQPGYTAINPKSTIPTLVREDGSSLTEFCAIAWWLGRRYAKAGLLPNDPETETRIVETLSYVVNTIHMQGFTRIFTPDNYLFGNEADLPRIKAQGETIVRKGLALMNRQLENRDYIAGDFSIADAALFYCEFWADRSAIPLPDNCRSHYQRMLARPAVKQVLSEEGYGMLYNQAASVS